MSIVPNFLKSFSSKQILKEFQKQFMFYKKVNRTFADKPKKDLATKRQVQGTENEERLRVRRARPADVPRVLRFVRESSRSWPGPQGAASRLVLGDYVARTLAQGHSMLAEQHEARRGWNQVRGLALAAATCPWDACIMERWARCVRCPRSRRLMQFSAHCLRAPGLHDKYGVHKIMQIILIVPPNSPKNAEVIQVLAKNAIQRGREIGFPLLRFDVADSTIARSLEALNLKKEWQLPYDVLPDAIKDVEGGESKERMNKAKVNINGKFFAVYTVLTDSSK